MHLYTVGHSNRALQDLLALLAAHGVEAIADVRRYPASRRHPQFEGAALERALGEVGRDYVHVVELGGMRLARPDTPHVALAADMFRGYADHMASEEFARGLEKLLALAAVKRTAAMCAEADPAHCHRSLLSDALVARGHTVEHIVDLGPTRPHRLNANARLEGEWLVYDGSQGRLPL